MNNGRITRSRGSEAATKMGGSAKLVNRNPLLFEYHSPAHLDQQDGIASRTSISVFKADAALLASPRFLNDTIISFFMQYHWDHEVADEVKRCTHVFNSFFFAKLRSIKMKQKTDKLDDSLQGDNSYTCIQRWFKGVRIFDKDFLIMPICDRDHWLLAVICYPASQTSAQNPSTIPNDELREPAVIMLNSYFGHAPSVKKALNKFLTWQWHKERGQLRKFNINYSGKPRNSIRLLFPQMPQQRNSYNCGVYMLNFFYCFLKNPRKYYIKMFRDKDMNGWFEECCRDMKNERKRMVSIISKQHDMWIKSRSKIKEFDLVDDEEKEDELVMLRKSVSPSVELMDTNNGRKTTGSVIIIH